MNAASRPISDAADRALLDAIVSAPSAPYSQWASMTGQSPRTVARRFEALSRAGAVRVVGRTLPGFGGRIAWIVRIVGSPALLGPLGADIAALAASRWVRLSRDRSELLGGFVTAVEEYHHVLGLVYSQFPARDVRIYQLVHVWGGPGAVVHGAETMDSIDQGLIDLLARNGRLSSVAAAKALSVDPATVSRRRQRLVNSGILYFEAEVAPTALGTTGDFSVWFEVAPGHITALGEHLRAQATTRFVAATSGTTSIYANVVLPDAARLPAFYDSLADFGIRSVEAVPMGQLLKQSVSA